MNKQKTQRRRAPSTTDVQMLDLHESPIYGVDLSRDTRMLEFHTRLVEIEDRIRLLIGIPIKIVKLAGNQLQVVMLDTLPTSVRAKIHQAMRGELGRKRRLRRVN